MMAQVRSFVVATALAVATILVGFPHATDAAVHPYNNEYFYSVGDAFIFRGGREGLFESKSEVRSTSQERYDDAQQPTCVLV